MTDMTYERAVANANLDAGRAPCHSLGDLFTSRYDADHARAKPICGICPPAQVAACIGIRDQCRTEYGGDALEGTWAGQLLRPAHTPQQGRSMSTPQRIQRKRTKGWRMPEGAVYIGRPTIFGNPFRAYKCECCGYWDVRDDNDVTYLVNHEYVRQEHVRRDFRTWTSRDQANRESVRLYNDELTYWVGGRMKWDPAFREAVESLRGQDLACWCPLDQPCHADILLEIANGAA